MRSRLPEVGCEAPPASPRGGSRMLTKGAELAPWAARKEAVRSPQSAPDQARKIKHKHLKLQPIA